MRALALTLPVIVSEYVGQSIGGCSFLEVINDRHSEHSKESVHGN